LQQRYYRDDTRRENEKKKLGEAELAADMFTMEVKMMAVSY
jgi:hypothetical protein